MSLYLRAFETLASTLTSLIYRNTRKKI